MPEVTRRRTGELLRTHFQILLDRPEDVPGREALAKLRTQVTLTEHQKGRYAAVASLT